MIGARVPGQQRSTRPAWLKKRLAPGNQREQGASELLPRRGRAKRMNRTTPRELLDTKVEGGRENSLSPTRRVTEPPSGKRVPDDASPRAPPTHARTPWPRLSRRSGPALRIDRPSHRPHSPAPHGQAKLSRPCGVCVCVCVWVYVFTGHRLSPGKMMAAATEARLRRTVVTPAPTSRNGRRCRDWDATRAGRPGLRTGLRLPRRWRRLLLLLLPPLLLLPWAAEAAAAAASVSGSAAAEAKECDRPCVNGGRCNPGTGQCVCPAGWVGEQCQHCGGRFR